MVRRREPFGMAIDEAKALVSIRGCGEMFRVFANNGARQVFGIARGATEIEGR